MKAEMTYRQARAELTTRIDWIAERKGYIARIVRKGRVIWSGDIVGTHSEGVEQADLGVYAVASAMAGHLSAEETEGRR